MFNINQKLKLILYFKKGIISKDQLKRVLKFGTPAPAIMADGEPTDRDKELLSIEWIYKLLNERIIKITFEND